ncbi:unnamed protein product [Cuscuta campestris]|uniref:Uncharacterized protein n=1 Tax=Cuscuta campestris TaxID=132261 RepID=A0A484NHM2_9ASTE|nr:unnamed protein product [Cuscuta campestris]
MISRVGRLLYLTSVGGDEISPSPIGVKFGAIAVLNVNAPLAPCTDSITRLSFDSERLTLFILRDGQRDIPCCLQMLIIVVGQTVNRKIICKTPIVSFLESSN